MQKQETWGEQNKRLIDKQMNIIDPQFTVGQIWVKIEEKRSLFCNFYFRQSTHLTMIQKLKKKVCFTIFTLDTLSTPLTMTQKLGSCDQ